MKLNEAIAPGGAELVKVKKIADQASKVIISGIDKIASKTNMADEFQFYSMGFYDLPTNNFSLLIPKLLYLFPLPYIKYLLPLH